MHAAGALDRFANYGGDPLALFGKERGCRLQVVVGNLHEVGDQVAPTLPVGGDALGAGTAEVGAVVSVSAAHHDLAISVAPLLVVLAGDLER